MLIISQDKKSVFNFERIMFIEIAENKTTIRCQIEHMNCWLGNYKTHERAKEVLDLIIISYGNINMINIPKITINQEIPTTELIKNICFQMPEK